MSLDLGELVGYIRADDQQFVRALDEDTARMGRFQATTGAQLRDLEDTFGTRGRGMGRALGLGLEEALAGLHPQVQVDANARPADERVAALFRRIEALRARIDVDVPPEDALAEVSEIRDALQLLSQRHADPEVRVQAAEAVGALETVRGLLADVDGDDPHVDVDVDAGAALAELHEVDRAERGIGDNDGPRRAGSLFGMLGNAAGAVLGPIGSVLGQIGLMAGLVGAAVPVVAGLIATLVNVAPAAAAGVTAVLSLASAVAAIKIGTGGVGDALKAAFAPVAGGGGGGGGSAAAAASRARAVADAMRQVKDATAQAAVANQQAAEQTARAERNVADAQKAARQAQEDLNASREQATRDLEDMNESLKDAYVDQEQAVLDVQTAQEALDKDRKAGSGASAEQIRQDEINLERAQRRLEEQDITVKRLQADTDKANKAGVEGSQTMINARQKVADANRNVSDQEQALADQRAQQARTAAQGIENIQKATEALKAASERAAGGSGGGGGVDKLGQALAALSPNARAFVLQVIALRGQWTALQQAVQDRLFAGLAGELRATAAVLLPVFRTGLVSTAGVLNSMARGAAAAAREVGRDGTLGRALAGANQGLRSFAGVPAVVIRAFAQIAAAGAPAFAQFAAGASNAISRIGTRLDAAFRSGRMEQAIQTAVGLLREMGQIAGNIISILRSVLDAAAQSGGGFLGVLRQITAVLAQAFASPAVQAGLSALYQTMGVLARTLGPLLVQALTLLAGVFTALAPPVQALISALGTALQPILAALAPVLTTIGTTVVPLLTMAVQELAPVIVALIGPIGVVIQALGAGLRPIIAALGPVLLAAAQAVGALLLAVAPLLPIVGQMIAALGPVLTPILQIIGDLFAALGPPLLELGRVLLPPVARIMGTLAQAFRLLEPVLDTALQQLGTRGLIPIIDGLGRVISTLVTQYSQQFMLMFSQLLPIIPLLTPVLVQLGISIGQILQAVAPLVPQLALLGVEFINAVLPALIPLIPPLAQLTVLLLRLATGTITHVVIPVLAGLAKVMQGLRRAFQPALDAVTWLTKAISGAFEWLYDHLVGHSVIPDTINAIVSWFAGLPGRAWRALTGLAYNLALRAQDALNAMINAISVGLRAAVSWIGDLPGRAWSALGDLSTVLYRSGQALLRGFVNGIKSMGSVVSNAVAGVVGSARDLFPFSPAKRGPFSGKGWTLYSGMAIGQALASGMSSQNAAVAAAARALAATAHDGIAAAGTPVGALTTPPASVRPAGRTAPGYGPAGGRQEPQTLRLVIDGRRGADELTKLFRKIISVGGGDVQVVMGRG